MLDHLELRENDTMCFPDNCVFDIDIDFECNNGQGAWIVILRRDSEPLQSLADCKAMEQDQPDQH